MQRPHHKRIETFSATTRTQHGGLRLLGVSLPRQAYEDAVKFQLFAYAYTQDVVFLWDAYRIARLGGIAIPSLVLNYLDACSDAVLSNASNTKIMQAMRLSHPKGGAGASKHARAKRQQVSILFDLLKQYGQVRAGVVASKLEARRIVARAHGTSEGRVHQLELKAGL